MNSRGAAPPTVDGMVNCGIVTVDTAGDTGGELNDCEDVRARSRTNPREEMTMLRVTDYVRDIPHS